MEIQTPDATSPSPPQDKRIPRGRVGRLDNDAGLAGELIFRIVKDLLATAFQFHISPRPSIDETGYESL